MQGQQERQELAGNRAGDGARLLALHNERERLDGEGATLWRGFSAAVLAAGPHTMEPPGERSNKFDFVKQGLRMRRSDGPLLRIAALALIFGIYADVSFALPPV